MKVLKRYKDGSVKIHIEDSDSYDCTDDNGVDVWLTKEQVNEISSEIYKNLRSDIAKEMDAILFSHKDHTLRDEMIAFKERIEIKVKEQVEEIGGRE
jgi:CO dehydrogenase/acetyl-CoA synthase beta subunit